MSLQKQINDDYIAAMKAKSENKATLGLIRSALKQVEVDTRKELTDEDVIKILKSEAKKRKDSIEAYTDGGRDDLAANEQAELVIIEKYLPAQMTAEQIKPIVAQAIKDSGATGPTDMGKAMGTAMGAVKKAGDADGKLVQTIVKEMLENM